MERRNFKQQLTIQVTPGSQTSFAGRIVSGAFSKSLREVYRTCATYNAPLRSTLKEEKFLTEDVINQLLEHMKGRPYYYLPEFWISTILGLLGLVISWLSFKEAGKAKDAALRAAQSMKIQSIRNELQEISSSMGWLNDKLDYTTARNKLDDITRKILRLIYSLPEKENLSDARQKIEEALNNAREALTMVSPTNESGNSFNNSVYFALEGHLANIGNLTSILIGICEGQDVGEFK